MYAPELYKNRHACKCTSKSANVLCDFTHISMMAVVSFTASFQDQDQLDGCYINLSSLFNSAIRIMCIHVCVCTYIYVYI